MRLHALFCTPLALQARELREMGVPDYITHARGYSEQPAPASGYQGMSCLLLGGRAAIRSTSGPLAALVLLAIRSSELATQLFKTTLKLL